MTRAAGESPGRIAQAFARARQEKRCALIPYVTAGDPDLARTRSIARALTRGGADLLEIGVPFSDPIADGPVNQRAAERALRNGVTLKSCLDLASALRADGAPPVVLFTYYNPIHRMGPATFASAAAKAGVDGVLVTDLPPEEAEELRRDLRARDVDLIFLLSPVSSPERVARICGEGSGFLYFISRTGVTGIRDDVPEGLAKQVRSAREGSALPVAVGFGVGRRDQAAAIARFADGIVVGSALMSLIEQGAGSPDLEGRIEALCRDLCVPLGG